MNAKKNNTTASTEKAQPKKAEKTKPKKVEKEVKKNQTKVNESSKS